MQTWGIIIKNVERDTIQAMDIADTPIIPSRLNNFINHLKLPEKNLLDLQRYVESQLDEIRNKVGPGEIEKNTGGNKRTNEGTGARRSTRIPELSLVINIFLFCLKKNSNVY